MNCLWSLAGTDTCEFVWPLTCSIITLVLVLGPHTLVVTHNQRLYLIVEESLKKNHNLSKQHVITDHFVPTIKTSCPLIASTVEIYAAKFTFFMRRNMPKLVYGDDSITNQNSVARKEVVYSNCGFCVDSSRKRNVHCFNDEHYVNSNRMKLQRRCLAKSLIRMRRSMTSI